MGDDHLKLQRKLEMGKGESSSQKRITDFTIRKEKPRKEEEKVESPDIAIAAGGELSDQEPGEAYWKALCQEREKALNDTIEENTDIGELIKTRKTEIDELEKENSILRDENKILAEKAAKAEPLADMLAEILAE